MNFLSYPSFFSNPNDIGTYNRYMFRSGQNFQRAYASANEDPDLVNMVLLSSGNLIAADAYTSRQLQPVLIGLSPEGNLLWQRSLPISMFGRLRFLMYGKKAWFCSLCGGM